MPIRTRGRDCAGASAVGGSTVGYADRRPATADHQASDRSADSERRWTTARPPLRSSATRHSGPISKPASIRSGPKPASISTSFPRSPLQQHVRLSGQRREPARDNSGDLNTIFTNAASAGVLNSDSLTLNQFWSTSCPHSSRSAKHVGRLRPGPGNGIMAFVGDNLLTFENGRDVVASVIAHEIGHNLGSQSHKQWQCESDEPKRFNTATYGFANQLPRAPPTSPACTRRQPSSATTTATAASTPPTTSSGDNGGTGKTYAEWRSHFGQTAGSGVSQWATASVCRQHGINAGAGTELAPVFAHALAIMLSQRRRTPR